MEYGDSADRRLAAKTTTSSFSTPSWTSGLDKMGERFSRRLRKVGLLAADEGVVGVQLKCPLPDLCDLGVVFAVDQELTPYSNAAKIRQLFVTPNAAEQSFFFARALRA
jgi:hypothetical protein